MRLKLFRHVPLAGILAAALLVGTAGHAQTTNQPKEKLTGGHTVKGNPADRIYVMDSVFNHLTDSRLNLFDGPTGKFLGMVPTAFNGHAQISRDGKKIYVATTYFERVTRGKRTDVIEVWDGAKLSFDQEIIIPPKRAGALNYDGMFRQTNDGRYVLLQNGTPAASVTVVDMQKHAFVQEITATAGCWSIIPLPGTPHSFATICGDGSLLRIDLGADGKLAAEHRSKPMFPVQDDPIFISPGFLSDRLVFVSFYGNVYTAHIEKDGLRFDPPWSLLDDKDKADNWVPGGYNLMAVNPQTERMYIFMHPHGVEGSHKNPAAEIWVYDLKTRQRIARVPGKDALSMSVVQGKAPRLLTLDGGNVHVYDISAAEPKLLSSIAAAGEAALQVFGQPTGAGHD
jgi:aralkylamine dehydrogenase heavy chain/methylamine dehydrogenase heavy chain